MDHSVRNILLKALLALGLLMLAYLIVTHFKQPVVEPGPIVTQPQKTWGAYTGNTDESMREFENLVESTMPIHVMFWGWDEVFPESTAGADGKTLLLFWEPSFGYKTIADGSQDAYVRKFAQGAKAYGFPIMLAPFDEFNLNESAWGNGIGGNTPELFIKAWRRVYAIFREEGADNVQFALVYNNNTVPEGTFASFYPGDGYVDIIGVDGFNFDTKTFAEIFDTALEEAKQFSKPLWIASTGSVWPQTDFIQALGATGLPWIWFNEAPFDIKADAVSAFHALALSFSTTTDAGL